MIHALGQKAQPKIEDAPLTNNNTLGSILKDSKKVIIVPGYGMALAHAQDLVKDLEVQLEKKWYRSALWYPPRCGTNAWSYECTPL